MSDISLNELNLENIGVWPMPIKVVVIVLIFAIIVALGYFLSFKSQMAELNQLSIKEIDLLKTMELKQRQAASLPLYKAQLVTMQEKFGQLLKQLPGKSEIPELLEEISKKGLKVGLKFQLFDPEPEIEHDFYTEIPIKMIVDGSYHQLALFVSEISGMRRIVTMHDFDIRFPNPKKEEGKKPIRLINGQLPLFMTVTAKVYRYQS